MPVTNVAYMYASASHRY